MAGKRSLRGKRFLFHKQDALSYKRMPNSNPFIRLSGNSKSSTLILRCQRRKYDVNIIKREFVSTRVRSTATTGLFDLRNGKFRVKKVLSQRAPKK